MLETQYAKNIPGKHWPGEGMKKPHPLVRGGVERFSP
jgi:hypothetical protein